MVALTYTFEGGTNGATLASGGTGSGNPLDVVSIGSSATAVHDTAHPAHGGLGARFATGASAVACYGAWTTSLGSTARLGWRAYLYLTGAPAVAQIPVRGLGATAQKFRVSINTTGRVEVRDNANALLATSTNPLPFGAICRIAGDFTAGAAGPYDVRIFTAPDAADTAWTDRLTGTGGFGSANFDEIRFGVGASVANCPSLWFDDIGASDFGFMGPAVWTTTPDGLAVAAAAGAPTAAGVWQAGPGGLAVPAATGAPSVSGVWRASPTGLVVPTAVGAPTVTAVTAGGPAAPPGRGTPTVVRRSTISIPRASALTIPTRGEVTPR